MKKQLLIWVFGLLTGTVFAQNYTRTETGIKTNIQSMDVEVQFFTPSVVRVIKSLRWIMPANHPAGIR